MQFSTSHNSRNIRNLCIQTEPVTIGADAIYIYIYIYKYINPSVTSVIVVHDAWLAKRHLFVCIGELGLQPGPSGLPAEGMLSATLAVCF